jgi:hypothetical protein
MEEYTSSKEFGDTIRFTLLSMQDATEQKLGRKVDINAVSYPEHFREHF